MNDPILEVLMNGTQTAVDARQITPNEAEQLRKEFQHAADIEVEGHISEAMGNAG